MIHENNGPVFPVVIFPENIRKAGFYSEVQRFEA